MGHVVRMTMTGALGITFVFLVDAANLFWVSQLGDPRLMAAVGFAFAIQFFSVSVGIGLMIASTALVSRGIGADQRDLARRHASSAATMAFFIQAGVAAAIIAFRHDILAASGATGETAALAARYLVITMPSLSVMAIALIASGALRAEGDGRRSMYVTLTSGAVAMVVDPLLILGLGLGLDGAAMGLSLSRVVMLIMALRFAVGTHDLMARPALRDIRMTIPPYFAIAIPAVLTQLATPAGNYMLTSVIAQFGDDAMAGWAVVGRLTVVAFGGIFSLSGAIGGIFGQNFGARKYDRLQSTYRNALLFGLIYTLITWAVLASVSDAVTRGFALSPEGADVVWAFTHIGAGGFVFAGALFVSNAAFNSLGKPMRSTLVNWTRDGVLTLPFALAFAGWFHAPGVIYAQAAVGIVVGVGACWWGWRHVKSLSRQSLPAVDVAPARAYAVADRFRRR